MHTLAPDIRAASPAQERVWFQYQVAPEHPHYNIPYAFFFDAPLNVSALSQALHFVIRRHESLRTTFSMQGGRVTQCVWSERPFDLQVERWAARSDSAATTRRLQTLARAPFDLVAGPLVRAHLLRSADLGDVLLLCQHHVVSDYASWSIFLEELGAAYEMVSRHGAPPAMATPLQYAECCRAQRAWLASPEGQGQLDYWAAALAGRNEILQLPCARVRAATPSFTGERLDSTIDGALAERVRSFARGERLTPFMALLAVFKILLFRYTRQSDLTVATMTSGRSTVDAERSIGFFVNTIPIRTAIHGGATFRGYARNVRRAVLGAFEAGEVPFEQIVQRVKPARALNVNPIAQVAFVLHYGDGPVLRLPEGTAPAVAVDTGSAKFDLTLCIFDRGHSLECAFEYATDVYACADIRTLADQFGPLTAALLDAPDQRLGCTPLIAPVQRAPSAGYDGAGETFPHDTLIELIGARVAMSERAVAVEDGVASLRFAELDAMSDRITGYLQARDIAPNQPIAICMARSCELVATILGILKAGDYYVPVALDCPRERRQHILDQLGAPLVICDLDGLARFSGTAANAVSVADVLREGSHAPIPNPRVTGQDLATVLFTSGSTGMPKGVLVPHRGLANAIQSVQRRYPMGPGDKTLMKTSYTFDVSIGEIFGTLAAGATLIVAPEGAETEPDVLASLVQRASVTVATFVPSQLRAFLGAPEAARCVSLRLVFAIGEPLTRELVRTFHRVLSGQLVNLYGPTETSIEASESECAADCEDVSIGTALDNVSLHVLDDELRPVPPGAIGELAIGGVALTRGYLNDPATTAERFVPDPFSSTGGRLYRTGDFVTQLVGGELKFVGREDVQIKHRGFRIELTDVEEIIRRSPLVKAAAVQLVPVARDETALCAAIVPAPGAIVDMPSLRDSIAGALPSYMMPAQLHLLEKLPVTSSGKIDRKALGQLLLRPRALASTEVFESETERCMADIWREVLGVDAQPRENFFELGGHSLLAAALVQHVRSVLGAPLRVSDVFERPTIRELAARVDRVLPQQQNRPGTVECDMAGVPLTRQQRALFFLQQLYPDMSAYNLHVVVRVEGRFDVGRLASALRLVLRRHPVLTSRIQHEGTEPILVAGGAAPVRRLRLDGIGGSDAVEEYLVQEGSTPFTLDEGVFRATIAEISNDACAVSLCAHHLVADGLSLNILASELVDAYADLAEGTDRFLRTADPSTLAAYCRSHETPCCGSGDAPVLRAYWQDVLRSAPAETSPARRRPGRPHSFSFEGRCLSFVVDRTAVQRLTELARRRKTTLVTGLVGWVGLALEIQNRRGDIVLGLVHSLRTPEDARVVGNFADTFPVRMQLADSETFDDVLDRAAEAVRRSLAGATRSFAEIVEDVAPTRRLSRNPLFQIAVSYQPEPFVSRHESGARFRLSRIHTRTSKFDLSIDVAPQADGELLISLEYNHPLLEESDMLEFSDLLQRLMKQVATAPSRPLSELAPCAAVAAAPIWAPTFAGPNLYSELQARFRALPERTAVFDDAERLSYAMLQQRVETFAAALRMHGATRGVPIAMLLEPSCDMVAAIAAVTATGSFYVPMNPGLPRARLAALVTAVGARLLITDRRTRHQIPCSLAVRPLVVEDLRRQPHSALPSGKCDAADPADPAYVIYTSGSSGQPKGVVVRHENVLALLRAAASVLDLKSTDVWSLYHNYSFDVAVWEMWGALLNGAAVAVVPSRIRVLPDEFVEFLRDNRVTILSQTPTAFRSVADRFIERRSEDDVSLRYVVFGGEALDASTVRRWFTHFGDERPRLINMYGITETTVHVTYERLTAQDIERGAITIGVPLPGYSVHILDDRFSEVPEGEIGELYVGGDGVATGYLNGRAQTAARFLPDPFANDGQRMYRSGDLGRRRPDGRLEFCGRADRQIKVRGFRVELSELERAITDHPAVAAAVAMIDKEAEPPRLVVYWVAQHGRCANRAALRGHAAQRLPDYMLPTEFVEVPELPLTPNGKLDTATLKSWRTQQVDAPPNASGDHLTEVLSAFRRALNSPTCGPADDFFDVGGNSLLASAVVAELRRVYGIDLPVSSIFERPTAHDLAAYIGALPALRHRESGARIVSRIPLETPAPLTFQQETSARHHLHGPNYNAENLATAIRISGELNRSALWSALASVVHRHDAFRTRFVERDGIIVQIAGSTTDIGFEDACVKDAAGLNAELETFVAQPFDVTRERLFRTRLWQCGPHDHVWVLVVNHLIIDGRSFQIVLREIAESYNAAVARRRPRLPSVRRQLADFAAWQRASASGELRQQVSYWVGQLRGLQVPRILPVNTVATANYAGATLRRRFEPPLVQRIEETAATLGVTPFVMLIAAWRVVQASMSDAPDQPIRVATENRVRAEFRSTVGRLTNAVFPIVRCESGWTFADLARRAGEALRAAWDNQEAPYEVVERELGPECPPVDGTLSLTLFDDPVAQLQLGNLDVDSMGIPGSVDAKRDLSIYLLRRKAAIEVALVFKTSRLATEPVSEFFRSWHSILELGCEAPRRRVGALLCEAGC